MNTIEYISQESVISIDDFHTIDWKQELNGIDRLSIDNLNDIFSNQLQKSIKEQNEKAIGVYALLESVSSYCLIFNDNKEIFKPKYTSNTFRTSAIYDLSNTSISILENLIKDVMHIPELKARFSDIVWVRERNKKYKIIEIAIDSYLEASLIFLNTEDWDRSIERIERALQLLKINHSKRQSVETFFKSILFEKNIQETSNLLAEKLTELLVRYNIEINLEDYFNIIKQKNEIYKFNNQWRQVRMSLEVFVNFYKIKKDNISLAKTLELIAESYEKEAEQAIDSNRNLKYLTANSFLHSSLEVLDRCNTINKETKERLHKRLLEIQPLIVNELKQNTFQIKLPDLRIDFSSICENKNFEECIFQFVSMFPMVGYNYILAEAKKHLQEFRFVNFLSMNIVNHKGKTIAKKSADRNAEDYEQKKLDYHVDKFLRLHYTSASVNIINPFLIFVNLNFNLGFPEIYSLIRHNHFIPPGREQIYAEALFNGFKGDYYIFASLIFPQLENSFRFLLYKNGHISSHLDRGIQDEYNMSTLFKVNYKEQKFSKLKDILGEDYFFQLFHLFESEFGPNIRNLASHGILEYSEYFSAPMIYLFGLTIVLLLGFRININEKI